jgi:hypothetical protein
VAAPERIRGPPRCSMSIRGPESRSVSGNVEVRTGINRGRKRFGRRGLNTVTVPRDANVRPDAASRATCASRPSTAELRVESIQRQTRSPRRTDVYPPGQKRSPVLSRLPRADG